MSFQTSLRFGFNFFLLVVFIYAAWHATGFTDLARYMPLFAATSAAVFMVLLLIKDYVKWRRVGYIAADETMGTATLGHVEDDQTDRSAPEDGAVAEDRSTDRAILARAGIIWAWILGYILAIYVAGIPAGTVIFLVLYLKFQSRLGWGAVAIGTVGILALTEALKGALNLEYPPYLLQYVLPLG